MEGNKKMGKFWRVITDKSDDNNRFNRKNVVYRLPAPTSGPLDLHPRTIFPASHPEEPALKVV